MREGRIAAALSHPHTVYIFGSDEIDGIPVIAMVLVTGGTLAHLVAEHGPLPIATAVDYTPDRPGPCPRRRDGHAAP